MSNKYGLFWNSNSGDRTYDADSFAEWLKPFFKNGVFVSSFSLTAGGGMTVSVGSGTAYINGKLRTFDTDTLLTIPTANGSYPRIDNIVVERNDTDREISLKVVQGTYSGTTASASDPKRANGIYQLVIARVAVGAGVTEITPSAITDCRAKSDLCGYVSNAIDRPDFEKWYQLNQSKFEEWFDNVKNQLSTDAAGNLQNQITAQNTELENNKKVLDKLTYPWNDQAIMGSDSYVCDVGQMFAATLNSNTSLTLADGEGILQGIRFRIPYGSTVNLTIVAGSSGYKRIDLVVARYTKSTGAISFVVIKGTNATSSPAIPAYNTGSVLGGAATVDFPLYKITLDGTTVSSVDKLFTQLQTMKEMQDAISKLNTDFNQNFESCAESYTCVRYKHFAHNVYARSRRGAKFHIAAINSTLYLVWLFNTNELSVTKLGNGTIQKGTGDVRVDSLRFHRADNLYLEIATDNDNVKVDITIYS